MEDFCEVVGTGLGPWREKATESLNADFDKVWSRYKVRDIENEKFGQGLFEAVVAYNSQHL